MDIEEILNGKQAIYREIMDALVTSFAPLTIDEIAEKINRPKEIVYDIIKVFPDEIIKAEYDEIKQVYTGRYSAGKQWDFYL